MKRSLFQGIKRCGAVLALSLTVACAPLLGTGTLERDMARTAANIDRIFQLNLETQKVVESRIKAMEAKQKADSELVLNNLVGIEQRIAALQESLDAIRSQVEEMRYRTLGESPDRVPLRVGRGETTTTVVLEGEQLFLDGQKALQRRDFNAARLSFQEFLKQFPASQRRADAQMWIAESYYREEKWAEALAAFREVEQQYLTSPRVPEALMKMALCEQHLNRTDQAIATLERLITNYPKWERLDQAQEMLRSLIKVEQVPPPLPR
ncbi:MAG: tol-pal system protein YbgF [Candidatus Sumerlaeia bacterium]|nr:tol-pal system protein YbgF [Candidatus Sumerlaeia bacterium]